jgi:hypothetical protein
MCLLKLIQEQEQKSTNLNPMQEPIALSIATMSLPHSWIYKAFENLDE